MLYDRVDRKIILDEARYILATKGTVRMAAKQFGRSKSSIHKDMRDRLLAINRVIAVEVAKVLDTNLVERTMRGGMATKRKYEERRN